MDTPTPPIQLSLTEEQQALIQRLSGQHVQVLELTPDPTDGATGAGEGLKFKWRLSVASGIPRQLWDFGKSRARASDSEPSASEPKDA
jgi:hypothetical protein